jgi:hypothetical protein
MSAQMTLPVILAKMAGALSRVQTSTEQRRIMGAMRAYNDAVCALARYQPKDTDELLQKLWTGFAILDADYRVDHEEDCPLHAPSDLAVRKLRKSMEMDVRAAVALKLKAAA